MLQASFRSDDVDMNPAGGNPPSQAASLPLLSLLAFLLCCLFLRHPVSPPFLAGHSPQLAQPPLLQALLSLLAGCLLLLLRHSVSPPFLAGHSPRQRPGNGF